MSLVLLFHLRVTCYHQITHALLPANLCSKGFTWYFIMHFTRWKHILSQQCWRVESVHFFFFFSYSVGSWHCSINFGKSTRIGKIDSCRKGIGKHSSKETNWKQILNLHAHSRSICKRLVALYYFFDLLFFKENIELAQGWAFHRWTIKKYLTITNRRKDRKYENE